MEVSVSTSAERCDFNVFEHNLQRDAVHEEVQSLKLSPSITHWLTDGYSAMVILCVTSLNRDSASAVMDSQSVLPVRAAAAAAERRRGAAGAAAAGAAAAAQLLQSVLHSDSFSSGTTAEDRTLQQQQQLLTPMSS